MMAGLGGVLCAAMVLPVVAASGIAVRNTADKVTATSLNVSALPERSAIYDSDGHLITYVYGVDAGNGADYQGVDRQPVAYNQISQNMLTAIVAIEDDRYWQHGAIDFQGTFRAFVSDLQGNSVQGGSTIVQQYVKGVLVLANLGNTAAEQQATADNLSRKYAELRMALNVSHNVTRQDILAGYLNDAYYENSAWGIEAAAETYFGERASQLTLTQAALLAGIVENPSLYDPITNPATALERRNTVLARMMQTHVLSAAAGNTAMAAPLGLRLEQAQSGCSAPTVGQDGFFCSFVIDTLLQDKTLGATPLDRARELATGGLHIDTTVSPDDETAATNAVNYVVPQWSNTYNPGHNADVEVALQPGTGKIMAIAEDRPYGTASGQTEVDYGVNRQYGGIDGVQTGSSSKLFTLITALKQGIPFGYTETVQNSQTVTGYTSCSGAPAGVSSDQQVGAWDVVNASASDQGTYSLYTGTTQSINTFYAELEQKVGLCNVVKTAMDLGLTWADGRSLLDSDGPNQPSADATPSFTLGSVTVSPMSMAAAYGTVAAGGIYCAPIGITSMTDSVGHSLPVPSANCHRAISQDVASAVDYILQGVLTGAGTASALGGITGYQAAGKTGTSNVDGNGTPYAAFAGFTTNLVSFTSVFNPTSPTGDTMGGENSCYRTEFFGQSCPGEMFGADAPGNTWHMTFDHANLGHSRPFPTLSNSSPLYGEGDGQTVVQQCGTNNNNTNNNNTNNTNTTNPACPPAKHKGGGKGGTTGGGGGGGGGGPAK
jgi:membrane peptidoglycan carboxypeptidase